MRLTMANQENTKNSELVSFSNWLLSIGNGTIPSMQLEGYGEEDNYIRIPDDLLIEYSEYPIQTIINHTYPDFAIKYSDYSYIRERTIITPINEIVEKYQV